MDKQETSRRWWLIPSIKLLVVALVVWGVGRTLRTAVAGLSEHHWTLRPGWLVAAGLLYLTGLFPAAYFWHRVLMALGQQPRLIESLRAHYIGQLGKYVPGKAMVVVIRAGLIRSSRVDTAVAALSVFVETLTFMSVGAFLAASILLIGFSEHTLLIWLAVGLMVAAGLPTWPPIFRSMVGWLPQRFNVRTIDLSRLTFRLLLGGWLGMMFGWCALGVSLWATLRASGATDLQLMSQLPLFTASVSLAVVAGFLSLLPGGIVVRDLILTELMVPRFGEVVALVSALLLRLVWLLSELVISSILYVWGRPPDATTPSALDQSDRRGT